MGSFNMHISVSKKIKEELSFGDEFMLGTVLPDLYKVLLKDRTLTHFEKNIEGEDLPDIEEFCEKYKDKKSEIVYGYLAHLVEDRIWFNQYHNKRYVKEIERGKYYKYIKDNTIHEEKEYLTDIYTDYTIISKYIENKYKIDREETNKILKETVLKSEKIKEKEELIHTIETRIIDYSCQYDINKPITFLTEQELDDYYQTTLEETKKVLIEFMEK